MSLNKEQFLLIKLIEECAEVSQEASKCIQFGLDETYSEIRISNKERLQKELKDLLCIIEFLSQQLDVNALISLEDFNNKRNKLNKYLECSNKLGLIENIQL